MGVNGFWGSVVEGVWYKLHAIFPKYVPPPTVRQYAIGEVAYGVIHRQLLVAVGVVLAALGGFVMGVVCGVAWLVKSQGGGILVTLGCCGI